MKPNAAATPTARAPVPKLRTAAMVAAAFFEEVVEAPAGAAVVELEPVGVVVGLLLVVVAAGEVVIH